MSLLSECNAHREVAEVLTMPKNTLLRLIDFLRTGASKPAFFAANPHGYHAHPVCGLGQGNSTVD